MPRWSSTFPPFPPRRLPDDFRQLQAITMGELNAKDLLVAAIRKHTGEKATAPQPAESKASGAEPLWPKVDFEALRSINPETVGWLTIEGTNIHYPVVQGQDNDFYLTHRFDGTSGGAGCLFLDAANDAAFQSANQIVYGHYMKDHSMFYDLGSYKKQDFYDAHPTGWLITPSAAYQLRFFSGYVSDPSGDAWKREFSGAEYVQWP